MIFNYLKSIVLLFWVVQFNNVAAQTGATEISTDTIRVLKSADTTVFYATDQVPVFPGGDGALMNFIQKNTRFPKQCLDSSVYTTTINMEFVIEIDGQITNIRSIKKNIRLPCF